MNGHTPEQFDLFMSQLLETNTTLGFYTDFKKTHSNVRAIAMKLHQLNYLIGKSGSDLDLAVTELWDENPKVFSVMGILIAVRPEEKKKVLDNNNKTRLITSYFECAEGVIEYIHKTGLDNVLANKQVTNLVDYVFGVEVGLDTNARKNRSGKIMENKVAQTLKSAGIQFLKEVYSNVYPVVHKQLGEDTKRFDFAIETASKTYLIEVNFYSSGGSKLNEVARAYTELAPKINSCPGYEFVWITDGSGWEKAKGKLEEAFYAIPNIYNLTTIDNFIALVKDHE